MGEAGASRRLGAVSIGLSALMVACGGASTASQSGTSVGTGAPASPSVEDARASVTPSPSETPRPSATPMPSPASAPIGALAYEDWTPPPPAAATSVIHVAAADGSSDVVLAEGGAPTWSPDGRQIAYACTADAQAAGRISDVCVVNADGSDPRLLVRGTALSPQWSPDGTRILFNTSPHDFGFTQVASADGTNIRDVGPGTGLWSPDGAWIALVDGAGGPTVTLTVVRADGTESRQLRSVGGNAEWSPDSARIATTWTEDTTTEIRAVDLRVGTEETLLTVDGAVGALAWIEPDTICYALETSGVWAADLVTGEVRQLTSEPWWGRDLVPSPDGAWLAFQVAAGEGYDIGLVSLGGDFVRLTDSSAALEPAWRPGAWDE